MTVAEMSRVDLTSDGWASSGGDAGESGDGLWRSYRTNHRPGWHPEVVSIFVEVEVAVPHLRPAVR
jgi:hypothetical protein